MRRWMMVAAALVVAGHAMGADEDPRRAAAEKLLNLLDMSKTYDQTMTQAMGMATNFDGFQNLPEAEKRQAVRSSEVATKVVMEKFAWAKTKDMFVAIYAEVLSLEELNGLIAFYESPIGRKFIAKQSELTALTMKKMQGLVMEIGPEIEKELENPAPEAKVEK